MQNEDTIRFCCLVNKGWDEEYCQKITTCENDQNDQSISVPVGSKVQIHSTQLLSHSEPMIKASKPSVLSNASSLKSLSNFNLEDGNGNSDFPSKTNGSKEITETTNTTVLNHSEDAENICNELIQALQNPRERLNILKFEKDIKKFMEDPMIQEFFFPPLTSYQRFAVHHLAQRFQLNHMSLKTGNSENHGIYLSKTPLSAIPNKLLFDLVSQKSQEQQLVKEKKQPKLLTKQNFKNKTKKTQKLNPVVSQKQNPESNDQIGSDCSLDRNNETNFKIKSVDERQKEYDDAKARIFQENSSSDVGLKNNSINKIQSENYSTPVTSFVGLESSSNNSRSKAMLRDREAEKSDPDFFRHSIPPRYSRPSITTPSNYIPAQSQFFPVHPMGNNYQFLNVPLHHQPSMNVFPFNQSQSQPQSQQTQQQHYSSYFYNSESLHPSAQTFQASSSQHHPHQYQQMIHPNILVGSGNRHESYQVTPSFPTQQPGIQSRFQDHLDEDFPPLKSLYK